MVDVNEESPMQDMTISEVLRDPLIRQMLRADKVSLGTFAALLENAALRKRNGVAVVRTSSSTRGRSTMEARLN